MRTIDGVLLDEDSPNKVVWAPSSFVRFSCRSFKRLLSTESHVSDRWKALWEMSISLKIKCFVWLVLENRIVVRDKLHK